MSNPIAYTVTATFTYDSVAKDWLDWLQTQHIADVMSHGATSATIVHTATLGASMETVAHRFRSGLHALARAADL